MKTEKESLIYLFQDYHFLTKSFFEETFVNQNIKNVFIVYLQDMEKIIGRENELSKLKDYYQSEKSEFIAIYGRRYVGKTFLIRIFFKDKRYRYYRRFA